MASASGIYPLLQMLPSTSISAQTKLETLDCQTWARAFQLPQAIGSAKRPREKSAVATMPDLQRRRLLSRYYRRIRLHIRPSFHDAKHLHLFLV